MEPPKEPPPGALSLSLSLSLFLSISRDCAVLLLLQKKDLKIK